eukprot:TRINITY_DN51284_c0_g1_i1.p1 TRINITY_DN51284_c0_g1~~TRINITY_DN51284_c0_g1_i1.p1  ORF type:complete len:212 (-),score=42.29 TRINITY_DN51284_c0_g1_i1:139-774(-)
MQADDLRTHTASEFREAISVVYHGIRVFEVPPPTQGLAALMALRIMDQLPVPGHNSGEDLHIMVESLRLAFADARAHICDPASCSVPVDGLLSDEYSTSRRGMISLDKAMADPVAGSPLPGSETVQFVAVDSDGNGCSMINSNYMGFGTGIVPKGWGFTLQNRGHNFSLVPGHPNQLAGGKRPYHTIIPGLSTIAESGELHSVFGLSLIHI